MSTSTQPSSAQDIPAGLHASLHVSSAQKTEFANAAEAYWHGDNSTARTILNPMLREDPRNLPALRLLAKACTDNNPAGSLRASAGRLVDDFAAIGDKTLLQKAFELAHLSAAYDKRQQVDAQQLVFARIALAEGDHEKAREHLQVALEHNPQHKKAKKLLRSFSEANETPERPAHHNNEPIRFGSAIGDDTPTPLPTRESWLNLVSYLNTLS